MYDLLSHARIYGHYSGLVYCLEILVVCESRVIDKVAGRTPQPVKVNTAGHRAIRRPVRWREGQRGHRCTIARKDLDLVILGKQEQLSIAGLQFLAARYKLRRFCWQVHPSLQRYR